jgi:hypothetical protein
MLTTCLFPLNSCFLQLFLSTFLGTKSSIPLTIQGDSSSSPFPSLDPALEALVLQTSVQGESACTRGFYSDNVPFHRVRSSAHDSAYHRQCHGRDPVNQLCQYRGRGESYWQRIYLGHLMTLTKLLNPLPVELVVEYVQSDAGLGNITSRFSHQFDPPLVIPPQSTANTGTIDNVLLLDGAVASLPLLSATSLDVAAAATVL